MKFPAFGTAGLVFKDLSDIDRRDAVAAAVDSGLTTFDSARCYTSADGAVESDQIVAELLRELALRARVRILSKGGHFRSGDAFPIDGRPDSIKRDLHESLRALGEDSISVYFLHWPDPQVPLAESVGALADLRDAGLIRGVGLSNVSLEQLRVGQSVTRIDAVENRISALDSRTYEMLAVTADDGIEFFAYSPLRVLREKPAAISDPAVARLEKKYSASVAQLLLAWHLALAEHLKPITGATRPQTIRASAAAGTLGLTADDHDELTAVFFTPAAD